MFQSVKEEIEPKELLRHLNKRYNEYSGLYTGKNTLLEQVQQDFRNEIGERKIVFNTETGMFVEEE